jgi:type VI protein secretion system component VasK
MNTNFDPARRQPQSLLARVLTIVLGLLALAAAFMFSIVIFSVVAIVGLILWLYFLWKTRALRQQIREQMREQMRAQDTAPPASEPDSSGEVIEGESVRVVDERNRLGG